MIEHGKKHFILGYCRICVFGRLGRGEGGRERISMECQKENTAENRLLRALSCLLYVRVHTGAFVFERLECVRDSEAV